MDSAIVRRAEKIQLLVLDVDGVLTDGRIVYTNSGDELKFFDVTDGMGLALWERVGLKSAILTAKGSDIVIRRSEVMHVTRVYQNAVRKLKVFSKILKDFDVKPEHVCFIGDDVVDIPVLEKVGFSVSVPNGVPEAKKAAHYITTKRGGRGAVREVIDIILKAQGRWDAVVKKYFT